MSLYLLVHQAGFEPATPWFVIRHSITRFRYPVFLLRQRTLNPLIGVRIAVPSQVKLSSYTGNQNHKFLITPTVPTLSQLFRIRNNKIHWKVDEHNMEKGTVLFDMWLSYCFRLRSRYMIMVSFSFSFCSRYLLLDLLSLLPASTSSKHISNNILAANSVWTSTIFVETHSFV